MCLLTLYIIYTISIWGLKVINQFYLLFDIDISDLAGRHCEYFKVPILLLYIYFFIDLYRGTGITSHDTTYFGDEDGIHRINVFFQLSKLHIHFF